MGPLILGFWQIACRSELREEMGLVTVPGPLRVSHPGTYSGHYFELFCHSALYAMLLFLFYIIYPTHRTSFITIQSAWCYTFLIELFFLSEKSTQGLIDACVLDLCVPLLGLCVPLLGSSVPSAGLKCPFAGLMCASAGLMCVIFDAQDRLW